LNPDGFRQGLRDGWKIANQLYLRNMAKEFGMHVSTVSLALCDHPRLCEETRSRIKALAARLGFFGEAADRGFAIAELILG
jgi:hypothetical protein